MRYFAEIDSNNIVTRVIVAHDIEWCQVNLGGTWIETADPYSPEPQEVAYCGSGYEWHDDVHKFSTPQPALNWVLYSEDGDPLARYVFPDDGHLYIPASKTIAEPLSRALFSLVYPGRDGLYCGVLPHLTDPNAHYLLQLRQTDIVPIALGADPNPLIGVLQIAVNDGALTSDEVMGIAQAVQAYAGHEVPLIGFVPPSWADRIMSEEQAKDAGYFE